MRLRSFLFVPGDSERKFAKASQTKADALILDLEDSVSGDRAGIARAMVRGHLDAFPRDGRRQKLWVRVNALDHPAALADIAAVVGGRPDSILLPKTRSGADVTQLDHYLSALEQREGVPIGAIQIMPVATETPVSMLSFGSYVGCSPRLFGLTWGAEDLAAALHASTNRLPDGRYEHTYRLARSVCLLGARAAGVEPIDTIWSDYRDAAGLAEDAAAARRAGFSGKVSIHPDQVDIINAAFSPSAEEIDHARQVVAAFETQGTGTVGLNGKMLDMPHLKQARQILALIDAVV
ncbi:CoA ester lyase [Azospirillum sp. YIM B02556]|uniref:CoA ester lyase n=1 Tax=Azospirillum endophyticum TaxID=2800326 RepID=A0ABS1EZG0_9PROT|nr:CoA ester lyase [Azospirillum endophyticum]MBK1836550.1 CoA ester lyase [Azospirillum endophyticum]